MGIGPFIGVVWLAAIALSLGIYACRYFHDQRMIGNTICLLFLTLTLAGFVGLVAFFPAFAFDSQRGGILFRAIFWLLPVSFIGVLLFSYLEWRKARFSRRSYPRNDTV